MKKIIPITAVALAALSLTACSQKNSDEAKKAFISNLTTLNSSDNNVQETTVTVDKFKASGTDSESANKMMQGSSMDMKIARDTKNKTVDLNGKISVDNKAYSINLILGKDGIYLNSSDVKSLYNSLAAPNLSKSAGRYASLYDSMINGLKTPYVSISQAMLDSSLSKNSTQNWSSTIDELMKTSTKSKSDIEKSYKDISDSNFTKKGDETTLSLTEKNVTMDELVKKFPSITSQISEQQLKDFTKETKNVKFKTLTVDTTINGKTKQSNATVSGVLVSTDKSSSNDSLDFKFSSQSKASKSSAAIVEPDTSKTTTIEELLQNMFSSYSTDASTSTN